MKNLFLPGMLYLGLIVGGLVPPLAESDLHLVVRCIFFFGVVFAFMRYGMSARPLRVAGLYVFTTSLLLLPLLLFTTNYLYAAQKIEAVLLGTISCFLFLSIIIRNHGWNGYLVLSIRFALLVLIVTLVYKAIFGFWDREVRFFLNGPIVFGWLMGMHALFALMLWISERKRVYVSIYMLFFSAVVWTQSKGPLLALILSSFIFVIFSAKENPKALRNIVMAILLIGGVAFLQADAILSLLEGSRLQSISALITGDTQESDQGSIGSRGDMLSEAVLFVSKEAPFGIGVGEWANKSKTGADYPHNEHLEILVEMGAPWFLIHFAFLVYAFKLACKDLRVLLIFFVIAASFSGDISYLRYIYLFSLASISFYGFRFSRAAPRRCNEVSRVGG